jgi:hypothetical protein
MQQPSSHFSGQGCMNGIGRARWGVQVMRQAFVASQCTKLSTGAEASIERSLLFTRSYGNRLWNFVFVLLEWKICVRLATSPVPAGLRCISCDSAGNVHLRMQSGNLYG